VQTMRYSPAARVDPPYASRHEMSPPNVAFRWAAYSCKGAAPRTKADQGDQTSAENANEQRHFN
jgi:hypothetical protein